MQVPKDKALFMEGMKQRHKNTLLEHLEIELVDIGDDFVILTMPITDKARQPMGLLHGGVTMALAESAAGVHSVWGIDLGEVAPVGIEITGSHVQSAREGTVRAEGKVISRTRSFIVHQVDIYHQETEKLLSSVRVRVYYKKITKDE